MVVMEIIFGLVIFSGGLYITLKESVPYERGYLPNILCGLGFILIAEGIFKLFNSR